MKRTISKVQLGQGRERETVRIEGDECPGPDDGVPGFKSLWDFITSLQTNPTLVRHSVTCPVEFKIAHSGKCWTLETSAEVDKP